MFRKVKKVNIVESAFYVYNFFFQYPADFKYELQFGLKSLRLVVVGPSELALKQTRILFTLKISFVPNISAERAIDRCLPMPRSDLLKNLSAKYIQFGLNAGVEDFKLVYLGGGGGGGVCRAN